MDFLDKIMTQFVRDRIKETNWENRFYIADLYKLERFVLNGGPHSMAEALHRKWLTENYPVEHECIRKELQKGEKTGLDEYILLQQNLIRKVLSKKWAELEARLVKDESELELWVKAGGR